MIEIELNLGGGRAVRTVNGEPEEFYYEFGLEDERTHEGRSHVRSAFVSFGKRRLKSPSAIGRLSVGRRYVRRDSGARVALASSAEVYLSSGARLLSAPNGVKINQRLTYPARPQDRGEKVRTT